MLYESIYVKFPKRQIHRDREEVSGYLDLGMGGINCKLA